MRSFAHKSSRLAGSSCLVQQSRTHVSKHSANRGFHQTAVRCSEASNSSSNNHGGRSSQVPPFEKSFGQKQADESRTETSEADSAVNETVEEHRKPDNWKSFRQRKHALDTLPSPPAIPDWFMKYNVKLRVDVVNANTSGQQEKALKLVDGQTGHVLFTVPLHAQKPSETSAKTFESPDVLAWALPWQQDELYVQNERLSQESHSSLLASLHERRQRRAELDQCQPEAEEKRTRDELIGAGKDTTENHRAKLAAVVEVTEPFVQEFTSKPETHPFPPFGTYLLLLRWVLLEAELAVTAGMTAAAETRQASSYAASRVDLSLLCPDAKCHDWMDGIVEFLANITKADIIRVDANDLADLTSEYVGRDLDSPGSLSSFAYDIFDGYKAIGPHTESQAEQDEADDFDQDEDASAPNNRSSFGPITKLFGTLRDRRHELEKALNGVIVDVSVDPELKSHAASSIRSRRAVADTSAPGLAQWEETRLDSLLDGLFEAPTLKRSQSASAPQTEAFAERSSSKHTEYSTNNMRLRDQGAQGWSEAVNESLRKIFDLRSGGSKVGGNHLTLEEQSYAAAAKDLDSASGTPPKIVHVRDMWDISQRPAGRAVIRRLIRAVRRRRQAGENILVVGTSCSDDFLSASEHNFEHLVQGLAYSEQTQSRMGLPVRNLMVPPRFQSQESPETQLPLSACASHTSSKPMYRRIMEINLRHIQSMLHRLRPGEMIDLFTDAAQRQFSASGLPPLSQDVFSQDVVQRIVLTAIGLSRTHARSGTVQPVHIGLAIYIIRQSLNTTEAWLKAYEEQLQSRQGSDSQIEGETRSTPDTANARLERIKKQCNTHETRLLSGVVDPLKIKVGFQQVHAPASTIEALTTLTSLSLTRPEAFRYGILAQDRLTGVMLYGPPGTGKTLLAKAVAKECHATVLEVNGAQIYEKYVGEGEKMVRAVFSLARKLSPCIVFIDEADSLFRQRRGDARNGQREIINQFLREWDGMDAHNILLMVASNRPFDIDDAVLRRLPRRVLVDLPTVQDRESILKIHLRDELLEDAVSLADLANNTPFYSGSDLKNLCVAAALACVREENQAQAQNKDDPDFKLPEKRTLGLSHFEIALKEVSASINEDMSSLKEIKKFDEQYGDRRGKRKKSGYGFGIGDAAMDETSARVRPPPPP